MSLGQGEAWKSRRARPLAHVGSSLYHILFQEGPDKLSVVLLLGSSLFLSGGLRPNLWNELLDSEK